jgi:hypothetical protein
MRAGEARHLINAETLLTGAEAAVDEYVPLMPTQTTH